MAEEKRGGLIYGICDPDHEEIRYIGATKKKLEERINLYRREVYRVSEYRPVIRWIRIKLICGWEFEDFEFSVVRRYDDVEFKTLRDCEQRIIEEWDSSSLLNIVGVEGASPSVAGWAQRKFSNPEVKEIRERYYNTDVTQEELGEEYGVDKNSIGAIVRGDTYKDVGGPRKEKETFRLFSNEQVREIRREYAQTDVTIHELANREDVCLGSIRKLLLGKNYKDAGGPIADQLNCGKRKLSDEEVMRIRKMRWEDGMSGAQISEGVDVSHTMVNKILRGQLYQDAPGPTSSP